jgi:hypothetical protein
LLKENPPPPFLMQSTFYPRLKFNISASIPKAETKKDRINVFLTEYKFLLLKVNEKKLDEPVTI